MYVCLHSTDTVIAKQKMASLLCCSCGAESLVFQKSISKRAPPTISITTSSSSSLSSPTNSSKRLQSKPRARMATNSSLKQEEQHPQPVVELERITLKNKYGENLVGLLHQTASNQLVILCHGFRSSKESATISSIADTIAKEGISVFRFDFSGNGESEGSFEYGNYMKEVDDLRSVVLYFSERKHTVITILGHSKGGNVVLLYASKYRDVPTIVNVAGRYKVEKGIKERLGEDFMQNIKREGFIDVIGKTGEVQYRVTEESLMERLGTDMHAASLSIEKNCRVLTVHGTSDATISVEDAYEFAKIIPNHKLQIIEGADHKFTKHQTQLAEVVLNFIKEYLQ